METIERKKRIFSGIQPSGHITIGNYIGALKNWVKLQDEYDCAYCVVDMHAITVRQNPADLRKRCLDFLTQYIACGLDPEKNIMFMQSHNPAHAELAWVLMCNSYMGELSHMTQFKDKTKNKQNESIGAGLFTYPVLMAADILLYGTDLVPVGIDQMQHLELARDLAIRFNNHYGDTFIVPEGYLSKTGAKIMSLQEPTKKMSKSDENPKAYITVTDEPDAIVKKIKSAVTDSDMKICRGEGKEGIENLMSIMGAITGKSFEEIEAEYQGKNYGIFKGDVAECVVEELRPVREKYLKLQGDKAYLEQIYKAGAEKAQLASRKILRKVYKKIGFIER
ncbi:MAG: tryptophan--tRNA ligase [Clostridia bacterium]|nr:tryptophan--tRNA ligase [Clostridia bacterium]